jgi:RNA polymerase sigma-70 factor, ECF subfamily
LGGVAAWPQGRFFVQVSVAEPAASGLETAAAARLYERHSSRVFGYCFRMLGSREEAEDASQTTFMQAFRALQRGVVPVFETAWLLTIAKNVCHARYRAVGRRKAVEFARDPHDIEALAAGAEPADAALMGLQDALARLPEMQRRAFLMREWQGRSYAEIGEELGVTVPAVEALIFRARRALASDLGGDKRRGHAFDIASLVAAVKGLLGGGAAVKVAVGAATVVSAGAVVGGAVQIQEKDAPAPAREVRSSTPVPSPSSSSTPSLRLFGRTRAVIAGDPARTAGNRPKTPAAPAVSPGSPAPTASEATAPQPAAPSPPVATTPRPAPPAAAPTPQPLPPAPAAPAAPALPEIPGLPPPPPLPTLPVELPQAPTDELPGSLAEVTELPIVGDLPLLP